MGSTLTIGKVDQYIMVNILWFDILKYKIA